MDVKESRNIRVFISSTFNDMQEERDVLVSKVFPLLRRIAAERQVSLTEIDLRWGITEEESKESKVVEICLEEIKRSHPFFIGLLGGRYGWQPGNEDTDWASILSPAYQEVAGDIAKGLSMTEIEIQYGALRNPENLNASFYLRKMPDADIDRLQKELREKVKAQTDFPVSEYSSAEELAHSVISDFTALLDRLYPKEEADSIEPLREQQRAYLRQATRYFVEDQKTEKAFLEFCFSEETPGLILTGEPGIGKKTTLARLTQTLRQREDSDVIAYFAGSGPGGSTFADLTDWICRNFEDLYGFDYDRVQLSANELSRAVREINPDRRLIIIIAGAERLTKAGGTDASMTWWPQMPDNIKVIFSTPKGTDIHRNLERYEYSTLELNPLNAEKKLELTHKFLKEGYNKTLTKEQSELLIRKNTIAENTLVFITLLDEIRKFGSFEHLSEEIERLTAFEDTDSFFDDILDGQGMLFDTDKEYYDFLLILYIIALSYEGLTETDILGATGVSRLFLSTVLGMNELNLVNRGGKITYANDMFRGAVARAYEEDPEARDMYRQIIVAYNLSVADGEALGADALQEVAYQYYMLRDLDNLYLTICSFDAFNKFKEAGRLYQLGLYWRTLLADSPRKYDVLNMVYKSMTPSNENGLWAGMNFYGVLMVQGELIKDFVNFIMLNVGHPESTLRLVHAMGKMLENEGDDFEHLRQFVEMNIGTAHRLDGNIRNALAAHRKKLDEVGGMYSAGVSNIGEILLVLFEKTGEEKYLHPAFEILMNVFEARVEKCGGRMNRDVAVAAANLASAMAYFDREKARTLNLHSVKIYEALDGFYSMDVAIQYHNMALQDLRTNPEKSVEYAEKALEIYERITGPDSEDTRDAHTLLGMARSAMENKH